MTPRRQLVLGLFAALGGLLVIAIGTLFPSSDPVVGLGWFELVPLLVTVCGTVFVFLGLSRRLKTVRGYTAASLLMGRAAVAGLGLALLFGALGIVSQVPDSVAGLNGSFVPGPAVGLGAFVLGGIGLAGGLVIGAVAALLEYRVERLHLR